MSVTERMKKYLSILLCLCMLVQNCPVVVFAAVEDNLCEHHTEHSQELCGYAAGAAEVVCTHEHTEDCLGTTVNCVHTHGMDGCTYIPGTEAVYCGHVCSAELCGYVAPNEGASCACVPGEDGTLAHTEGCGYMPADSGTPCGFVHEGCGCAAAVEATGECGHVCSAESGCEKTAYTCGHTEDGSCCYVAAVEAHPCHYVCAECAEPTADETTEPSSEAATEVAEPVAATAETTVTVHAAPNVDLPENSEIFALYAEQKLYGYEMATFGTQARAGLNLVEQNLYDALKANIEAVAQNGGSTVFAVSGIDGLKTSWTNTELGVEYITDAAVETAFAQQFSLDSIVTALLNDCPFDLYWYDKTSGAQETYGISYSGSAQDQWTSASISNLTFTFAVAGDFGSNNAVTTDVSKITAAASAANNLVNSTTGSDYEKLVAYKEYICSAVSYNQSAVDTNAPYGAPWQLINVFDGDDSTNVVCEGYSKAFQYLCDLGGLSCISVSGTMAGGTGAGGHMWNVVTLNGKNYLVDVTNCDEGTVGAPDKLFMVGGTYANGGYSYTIGSQTITYTCSDLNLSATDYGAQPVTPVTYTVNIADAIENGTVTADVTKAAEGEMVTLTVTANEGFVLDALTVIAENATAPTPVEAEGKYTFTMPSSNVTVTATFKEVASGIQAGYYLVGTLNGENKLSVDQDSSDRLLKEDTNVEGQYCLEYTFAAGDKLKIAYFDGQEITKWYKDDDFYPISEAKAGKCMLLFRPEGNESWSFTYFTVTPVYSVTVNTVENGTVTADKAVATAGETVTLTVTPAEGYELGQLEVVSGAGSVDLDEENFTFTMPNQNVTVTAYFHSLEKRTVYFDNSAAQWSQVNIFFWSDGNSQMTPWPGVGMTKAEGNIYSCQIPADAEYVIFNNGNIQTSNQILGDKNCCKGNVSESTWYTYPCEHTYESGVCTLCGAACAHTGTLGDPVPTADGTKHIATYSCCGAAGEPEDHNITGDGICDCGVQAQAKIGGNYYLTLAEAATKVTEGDTINVLTDVTIGADETVTFAAFATLDVAEGKTVTCNGTVKIGEEDGIIFENTLYYYGGDVTNESGGHGTLIHDFSRNIYYKAGNGYMLVIPATGTETAVLELYNANCTDQRGGQDEESLIGTTEALEIRFYGNSTLTCLGGYIDGAVLRSKASVTMIGMDAGATLTMQGGSENGTSTLYGIQIENGDLVIQSGTVTVRSGDGGNSCCGASIAGTLTVAPGAVLNAAGGESLYGFCVGLSASEIVAEGTLNALALLPDESGAGHYQVYGNAVLEHNLNSVLEIDSEHSYKFSFTVPTGTSLTVNSGVTLDLSALEAQDIDLTGTVINKGTILLPEGFDINDAPESGNIQIGEKSYTWDSEHDKWVCTVHTDADKNHICDVCTITVSEHNYGDLIPATEAVHTYSELKGAVAAHYRCSVCGTYFTESKTETTIEALTGETPTHAHDHYQSDYLKHYSVCTCGWQLAEGAHDYGEATHKCTICSRGKSFDVVMTANDDNNTTSNTICAYESSLEECISVIEEDYRPYRMTKTGYTWSGWGWFTDEACTQPYTGTTMPAQTLYLAGQWTANTYTVHWTLAGSLLESTSTFGQDFTQTFTVPENTHLEINGVHLWTDDSVPVNYTYENGVLTIAAADVPAADVYIDCYHYVEVKFDANGGVIIPEDGYPLPGDTGFAGDGSYWIQSGPFGWEIYLANCAEVRREGYTFVDWRDASGKVYPMTQVNGEKQVSATEDVTLYAQWQCLHTGEKNRTYENMGSYHNYVETCVICGENTDRGVMFEHDHDETTHSCVCGAIETFTITFNPANGEENIAITQDYGTPITAPELTYDGYHFVEWNTEVPATMPSVDEGLTITAIWEAHSGGKATCIEQAVCEICGTSYGNTVDHSMSYTAEGMTITYKCATCDTQTVTYTLVIPTGMVYGSSAMEVPHYTKIGEHSGDTPVITLKQGETTVNEPINAGTYAVTMTWGGQTVSGEYTIAPKELTEEGVTITLSPDSFFYDGSEKLPAVTVKLGDKTLDGGTYADGYTPDNTTCDYRLGLPLERVKPGRWAITVLFMNNYSGDAVVHYAITIPEAILSPDTPNGENGWHKDASLLAPNNYAISTTKDGPFGTSLSLSNDTYESINYWLTYPDNANCEPVSLTWTGSIKMDGTAPTVSGTADSVTDSTASITVTADDALSGVASVMLTCTDASVTIGALTAGAFPVSGMHPNRAYTFTLTAKDEAGNEAVTTVELTTEKGDSSVIEAPTVKSLTYTGQMQELVTAGSAVGGTLQYSVNGGEWSEAVPTASEAGDYQISYQVVGNSDYNGIGATALPVVRINKAKLTITAEDHTITYGNVPSANGVTGTGFITGESFEDLSGELAYSYNYEQFGKVGTYKITPSGVTSNNYEITFADGTLTVNAKAITVTADAVSKTYGDSDPTLTYKADGLVNGDKLTGQLMRAAGENVGTYDITVGTLANSNYTIDFTGAKLTINAKAITAADVNLNGSLAYSGKEQTQPITVTEGITYELTGDKGTKAGEYELTVKGTGNYTGSVMLDWVIAKAKLTITADSKVIYIGEKLPTLTCTVTGLVGSDELIKVPALTTNADADLAGSYTITAANADAGDNYTIIYVSGSLTIMDKETKVETKIEQTELTEVPEGLKDTRFDTVEEIKEELTSKILAIFTGYSAENMVHYDVVLYISLDGGDSWILATDENFPTEGITVILPYPEGTNPRDYDFVVSHMFTVTSQRLGTVAGEVEMPKVEETVNGIRVTLNGLSPVTVAARYHDHTGGTATCSDKAVCDICGSAYGELDSTNHAGGTEVKNAKEATCGAEGYTGDTHCKGCDKVVEKGTTIKATGKHIYGNWKVVKEPTKTTKGEKQRTCSVCSHVDTKEIPVLSDVPATGDDSNIILYGSMFTVSLAGLVVLLLAAKKRKQENA